MKKRKTTRSFKIIMFSKTIYPALNFRGTKLVFPYTWDGYRKFASISANDLFKVIKWDKTKV